MSTLSVDNRDLRPFVKEALKHSKDYDRQHAANPMDRYFGIPGISRPFMLMDYDDHSLESTRRRLARRIEDAEDGHLPWRDKGERIIAQRELKANTEEREIRNILRVCYGAAEGGTNHYTDWHASRNNIPIPDGTPEGAVPRNEDGSALAPSYKLALFMDHQNAVNGELHALIWPDAAPGEWRWGRRARDREEKAYHLWAESA